MTALAIVDLEMGKDLDRVALAEITGRGTHSWSLINKSISTGAWGGYKRLSQVYKGVKIHNGYLHRHYVEKWKRERKQYEYTTWNHYVKV